MTEDWIRSSLCDAVEIRDLGQSVAIRQTTTGQILVVTRAKWAEFLAGARAGDFDLDVGDG